MRAELAIQETGVVDDSGSDGNIWRTMPLIKPKERRVLSFHAMALCKNRGGQPVIPVTEGREREKRHRDLVKRALARKFAPIPFYSRDLDQLVLLLQNRAKPTRVTRSSARIAHGRSKTPLLPFSLSFSGSPSASICLFPLCPFASNPRPWCRFALLIDSRRFNRYLITS